MDIMVIPAIHFRWVKSVPRSQNSSELRRSPYTKVLNRLWLENASEISGMQYSTIVKQGVTG